MLSITEMALFTVVDSVEETLQLLCAEQMAV
jgi:hypothetical protein